jgi:P27 family predicted phage terminase small subunit
MDAFTIPPPPELDEAGIELWTAVQGEYGIADAGGLAILRTACQAADRAKQAQDAIRQAGIMTLDARGTPKAHPAVEVERQSHAGIRAALKALNLDLEPLRRIGRPAGT